MTHQDRIIIDPEKLIGQPVIRGTRLSVQLIIELLGQGCRHEDILLNFPGLTCEDIKACMRYARAGTDSR